MDKKSTHRQDDPVTDVNFSELILGFSSAALYYLGHAEADGKKIQEKNPPLAKQNIKIIELLEDKTKGNLTEHEEKLVRQVLNDLRLKFNSI